MINWYWALNVNADENLWPINLLDVLIIAFRKLGGSILWRYPLNLLYQFVFLCFFLKIFFYKINSTSWILLLKVVKKFQKKQKVVRWKNKMFKHAYDYLPKFYASKLIQNKLKTMISYQLWTHNSKFLVTYTKRFLTFVPQKVSWKKIESPIRNRKIIPCVEGILKK